MLAVTDFKLRFFGSALGYVWTLMRPLAALRRPLLRVHRGGALGGDIKHYPVYLLSSIVLFTFFPETTCRGVTSLVERENLLRKMRFPRLVIPLSVALHALFNLGAEHDRGVRVRPRHRASSRASAGWSCSRCSRCSWCSRPVWRCSCRPSTCATATSCRSGRWWCRSSSTPRPSSTWRPSCRTTSSARRSSTRSRRSSPRCGMP